MSGAGLVLERILVPVDGSASGDAALSFLSRFPGAGDPEVVLLRAVHRHSLLPASAREAELHEAVAHVTLLEKRLRQTGIDAHHLLRAGEPAEQILDAVRLLRPTLVAMSARGAGEATAPRGRVAEEVLARCAVPLLIGNPHSLPIDPGPGFARILVALDGSEVSARSLPLVGALARAHRSEVVLAHVDPEERDPAERARVLEPFRHRLEGSDEVRLRIATAVGEPALELLELAKREGADLLAMTSHARPDADRRWFGSTAETILRHATCPLLVVRIPAPAPAPR